MAWKSRILRDLHNEYGSCPVCQFIDGDRSPEIMLLVIERLDQHLDCRERECELLTRRLIEALTAQSMPVVGRTDE